MPINGATSGRIICGVDGGERGYEAVAVARDLARRLRRPLMLAHVVEEPAGFPFGDGQAMGRERQQRHAHGVRVLRDVAATLDLPPHVELRVESGDPAAMLRTLAEEERASMLVVASRGRGRIRSALFGSVSAGLVDGLACPMLVVTPGAASRYRLASEGNDAAVVCGLERATAVERLVPPAAELAAALADRLVIIHADLPPAGAGSVGMAGAPVGLEQPAADEATGRRILARAKELAPLPDVETRAELGDLATTMAAIGGDRAVQILVLAKDSAWQRPAAGAGCPVLVVPEPPVGTGGRMARAGTERRG